MGDLPAERREEILAEIEEHIAEDLADRPVASDADVRNVLERVGDPDDIAAEARERFGIPVTKPGTPWLEVMTLVFLGDSIPGVGRGHCAGMGIRQVDDARQGHRHGGRPWRRHSQLPGGGRHWPGRRGSTGGRAVVGSLPVGVPYRDLSWDQAARHLRRDARDSLTKVGTRPRRARPCAGAHGLYLLDGIDRVGPSSRWRSGTLRPANTSSGPFTITSVTSANPPTC